MYNIVNRQSESVLQYCEKNKMAFIPWFPLVSGDLSGLGEVIEKLAKEKNATPAQIALAWLLKRSPVIIPIPGTSTVKHLEENTGAALIKLTDKEFPLLESARK